jgi:SAM-dependent methyltransferase
MLPMNTNRYRHERVLALLHHAWRVLADYLPPQEAADLVLTLLFWRYYSMEWEAERRRLRKYYRAQFSQPTHLPHAGADQLAETTANQGRLRLDEAASWLALTGRERQDGNTLFFALQAFCARQSEPEAMLAMLRPQRFALGSRRFAEGDQTPLLAEVLHRLGQTDFGFYREEAPLDVPLLFAAAYQTVQASGPQPGQATLYLMAELLNPRADERVLDPDCGSGQALAACARTVRGPWAGLQAHLRGYSGDPDQLALAQMLLLTHRLDRFVLREAPAVAPPLGADLLAEVIVSDQVGATSATPGPDRLAWLEAASRYCLPGSGRIALAVAADWLRGEASLPLRTELVQRGWLDVVAWLPPQSNEASAVLLLRPAKRASTVRVLGLPGDSGSLSGTCEQPGVHQLVWAYRQEQAGAGRTPWLHELAAPTLAQQQYRLEMV